VDACSAAQSSSYESSRKAEQNRRKKEKKKARRQAKKASLGAGAQGGAFEHEVQGESPQELGEEDKDIRSLAIEIGRVDFISSEVPPLSQVSEAAAIFAVIISHFSCLLL